MKKINDILNKSLKVIITIMIVFSSMLVVNTNNVIAEGNEPVNPEPTKTYTVTFKNGFRTIDSIEVEAGTTIDINKIPGDPYADWRSASKTPVWYYRDGGLIIYKEYQWDFTNKKVDKDYTLYVKYKNIGSNGDFDFRVKHKNSKTFTEFNTGAYTNVDTDGYTYSYYSYEKGVKFSYTEGQTQDLYEGTSFDLAIQESNAGDTIQLLKDIKISEPITIWGDVNLDLNNKAITYDASFIQKLVNFINFFCKQFLGLSKPILPVKDDFNPAIFVYNAATTISDGTITNKAGGTTGHGIVVYSEKSDYIANLNNLTVVAITGADAVSTGYEGKIVENGLETSQQNAIGYAVINGGYYNGNIINYNNNGVGGSLIINDGNFSKDPITGTNAVLATNKYIYVDQSPRETYKYKVDEYKLEAVIVDGDQEISNETFVSALNKVQSGQTIKLVKDVNLTKNITIDNNGRSLTLDVNGHNITTDNNAKLTFIDSSSASKGEIQFDNSDDYFNGQVDVVIEINDAKATVVNGYYKSINADEKANVFVRGGYFVNAVATNCLQSGYVCNPLDQKFLNKYNYQVVYSDELIVAENETSGIEYSSLTKAINDANAGDRIKILKDIRFADTVTINKSLNISLASDVSIRSTTLKSFVISGQGTIVTIEGVNRANNTITNDAIANGNKSIVFEVQSNAKLVTKNITINADAQGCGDSELIAINTVGNDAGLKLESTNIVTNFEPDNKHIIALKNESSNAVIESNGLMFNILPCGECLDIVGILNSGNNSNINIKSSYIMLNAINNQTDYINYYGVHDTSYTSTLTLDQTYVMVTNNQGITCSVCIENDSTLNVINSSDITTTVENDSMNSHVQTGIKSKGTLKIDNSSIGALSNRGNASSISIEGGTALIDKSTVYVNAGINGYCLDVNNGAVSVTGEGYYRNGNLENIVNNNNGTVEISGGHFSSDISNWLARNYKCIENPYTIGGYTYDWSVDLSKCGLSVTVANDGTLVINYKITYDTFMLDNPSKYGVRFISTIDEYDGIQLSITDTKNNATRVNGQLKSKFEQNNNRGIYSFNIVARLMDSIIGVEIVDIDTGHVYHRKNQYSIDTYYYDILKTLNDDKTYKYKDSMRDLAAAALNYGAYCQKMANPNIAVEKLVNYLLDTYKDAKGQPYSKEFTGDYDVDMENKEPENTNVGDLIDDFTNLEHSLLLKESTTLRFRFDMANDGAKISDYEAYYKNVNESEDKYQKITPSSDSESCFLDIPGIKPYDFNEKFILKIVKGDKSCSIIYSPLDYIYKEYKNYLEDKKDEFLELARALYTYYKIASIYYGGL